MRAPTSQSLESYVASGWVDGLLRSSVRSLQVNGLPAVIATARAGEWNFRLAVIQLDNEVYRLIFAVRALNEDAERRFDASIASFRRLTPQEANDVRGLKIAVATAAPGDTIDTLAARMVTPNRPVEYFLLLNELDPGAAIVPGENYKIVTE